MSYKIVAKYSNELAPIEWIEIKDSFNLIFKFNTLKINIY